MVWWPYTGGNLQPVSTIFLPKENPQKNMENAFYLTQNALFDIKILKNFFVIFLFLDLNILRQS